ncbi:MAG: glycoside hydrolase family 97 N-terminal domain-containing protein, partial [Pedobacter sp.]|nr:glycoside hydrolase family 97 N-terminal domain-containing protein [Pedobacter sp.]
FTVNAKEYRLVSPDQKNVIKVSVNKTISWSIIRNHDTLLTPSQMGMTLGEKQRLGLAPTILNAVYSSVNKTIIAAIPIKNKLIPEVYRQLRLNIKGGYAIEFRAYNDGVAYRFVTDLGNRKVVIKDEEVILNFNKDCEIYLPKEDDPEFRSHYEGLFSAMKLAEIPSIKYGYLPLYVSDPSGCKMVITEADLKDYPNLFLFGSGGKSLSGRFPKVVLESKPTGNVHLDDILVRKADYNAETTGNRTYPWRVVIISPDDKGLLENELVYKLACENTIEDPEWIKPGKVAWDWWNDRTLYDVNFRAGINLDTYKYYINFAAEYGLDYVVLDEGWSKSASDVLHWNPDLDFPNVLKHANDKTVGVILWSLWKPLDENMDEILDQFVKWGIKGVKVDFMARADQYMV